MSLFIFLYYSLYNIKTIYKRLSMIIIDTNLYYYIMSEIYDYLLKCLIIGDSGTGKSSLMLRFTDDVFNTSYISTIGVDFKIKTIKYKDKNFKFQIWDTAGQDRFRTITSSYYRGANAVILCYDVTDKLSFSNINKWLEEVERFSLSKPILILCGTKTDLSSERKISFQEGLYYAEIKGMHFFETSSKNNSNIKEIFNVIADDKIKVTINLSNDIYDKSELRNRRTTTLQITNSDLIHNDKCC
jgi:Ras-related protein Rab-1A